MACKMKTKGPRMTRVTFDLTRDPLVGDRVEVELDNGERIQAVVIESYRTEDGKLTVKCDEIGPTKGPLTQNTPL